MKNIFILLLSLFCISAFAQDSIPEPNYDTWVSDQANILNDEEVSRKILDWDSTYNTGVQYAVVTINTLEGYDAAHYSANVGNLWGVGQNSNGIVILISPNDHKVFVYTGYGLEHIMTNYEARSFCVEAYDHEDVLAGEYTKGTLKLIELIQQKIGTISYDERYELEQVEAKARVKAEEERAEAIRGFLIKALSVFIIGGIIFYFILLIIKIVKIKKDYRRVKEKINIDTDDIKKSSRIQPHLENDLIVDLLLDTNSLEESLKQSNPLNLKHIETDTFNLRAEYNLLAAKFNNICSLIDTKSRLDTDITHMIEFLTPWTDHPNVTPLLTNILGMVGNIKLTNGLPYLYDNIRTRYQEVKNDIGIRKEIESDNIDLEKYTKLGNRAKVIARDLKLTFGYDEVLEEAKKLHSKVLDIKSENMVVENWLLVKETWILAKKKLDIYNANVSNILQIEDLYKNALKNIPFRVASINDSVDEASEKVRRNGVSTATKKTYGEFLDTWKDTATSSDGLSAMDSIKLLDKLVSLVAVIEKIVSKATSEHKEYENRIESASIRTNYTDSDNYSSGGRRRGNFGSESW